MDLKGKLFVINNENVYRLDFTEEHCTVVNKKFLPGIYLIVEDHFDVFCSVLDGDKVYLARYESIKDLILDPTT